METTKDNQNKKRLGRGLGSLLGGAASESEDSFVISKGGAQNIEMPEVSQNQNTENKIWNIAIDKLVPGVYQPRKNFEKESLNELANSIKENGIIQPITVRKRKEGGFEILAGERRWRAAQSAGLHEVPAIIKTYSDREALQVALIENIQREDLDPIEEAESYARLIEEFSLSQNEAAEKVGKERSSVANALRLLGLPPEVRTMLSNKEITTGHAKVILAVTDKNKQTNLAKKVVLAGLSVRALEAEIKANHSKKAGQSQGVEALAPLNMDLAEKLAAELADQLQKSLGTRVEITYKLGKGRVQVSFYTDDQLTEIYEKLKK